MKDDRPSFFADAMLGSLARWLRILGYDVLLADNETGDPEIIATMTREKERILLTRDKALFARASSQRIPALFIGSDVVEHQLSQVVREFSLDSSGIFTRCPVCGFRLEEMKKEDASALVPPKSFENSDRFWRCPSCEKVYWQGSHWKGILNMLMRCGVSLKEDMSIHKG